MIGWPTVAALNDSGDVIRGGRLAFPRDVLLKRRYHLPETDEPAANHTKHCRAS